MIVFEYIGAFLIASGQIARIFPKYIIKSLVLSLIGSVVLLVYSSITGQYGFVVINLISIVSNSIAIVKWKEVNIKEKTK